MRTADRIGKSAVPMPSYAKTEPPSSMPRNLERGTQQMRAAPVEYFGPLIVTGRHQSDPAQLDRLADFHLQQGYAATAERLASAAAAIRQTGGDRWARAVPR
jgi:hypothetical protein